MLAKHSFRRFSTLAGIALPIAMMGCAPGYDPNVQPVYGPGTTGVTASSTAPGSTSPGSTTPSPSPSPGPSTSPTPSGPLWTAAATGIPAGANAKIVADTNRDGKIDASDDKDKMKFDQNVGAVFAFNNDDDDNKKAIDASDSIVNGPDDPKDMARVVVCQLTGQPTKVTLAITPKAANVRVFKYDASTKKFSEFIPPAGTMSGDIPVADCLKGEVNLFMEGAGPRSKSWDGFVTLTLTVATGPNSTTDSVKLRESPAILTDNTRPAERVYCMKIDSPGNAPNDPFWKALTQGLAAQNVPLQDVDQNTYQFDRWVQDGMELGYQGYVSPNGPTTIWDFNQLERQRPLFDLIPKELLSKGSGMNYAGQGAAEGCNYGGNLEVIPPHQAGTTNYPFGRILIGGGDKGSVTGQVYSRHMNTEEQDFLDAQVQGPHLEISTEWLAVGHVDETAMAIANLKASGRPWRLAWASPALARAAMKQMVASGQGAVKIYKGRKSETDSQTVLNDATLMSYNDNVQQRLDANKQLLMTNCNLTAADFVEMPVYYEIVQQGGVDYGISQNPGVQNCIPVNDTLYIPDPEGPIDGTTKKDVWKTQIDSALAPLGIHAVYVDVFTSYHELMGEAHCGSNVMYKAYDTPWWKQ